MPTCVWKNLVCRNGVHKELFGDTTGPDNLFFTKFRDSCWKSIHTDQEFQTLKITNQALKSRRDMVIHSLKRILTVPDKNNSLPRDDYRQRAALMLTLLGETPERGVHWLRPGAAHHAWWMPSILYPAKTFAFSAQAGYDKDMVAKLKSLCSAVSMHFFYVEKWLNASVDADAPPYNDLLLWHELNDYKKHDPKVVNAANKAFDRHFWYLTEECVVLALFSNSLSNRKTKGIAQQLSRIPCPKNFEIGHPRFPVLTHTTKLVSWLISSVPSPGYRFIACTLILPG